MWQLIERSLADSLVFGIFSGLVLLSFFFILMEQAVEGIAGRYEAQKKRNCHTFALDFGSRKVLARHRATKKKKSIISLRNASRRVCLQEGVLEKRRLCIFTAAFQLYS